METPKPIEGSIDDINGGQELSPPDPDVARTPAPATRKPVGYIAAQLVTDPDSVYDWAYGTPPTED
jgi:hypothetical protein